MKWIYKTIIMGLMELKQGIFKKNLFFKELKTNFYDNNINMC